MLIHRSFSSHRLRIVFYICTKWSYMRSRCAIAADYRCAPSVQRNQCQNVVHNLRINTNYKPKARKNSFYKYLGIANSWYKSIYICWQFPKVPSARIDSWLSHKVFKTNLTILRSQWDRSSAAATGFRSRLSGRTEPSIILLLWSKLPSRVLLLC